MFLACVKMWTLFYQDVFSKNLRYQGILGWFDFFFERATTQRASCLQIFFVCLPAVRRYEPSLVGSVSVLSVCFEIKPL